MMQTVIVYKNCSSQSSSKIVGCSKRSVTNFRALKDDVEYEDVFVEVTCLSDISISPRTKSVDLQTAKKSGFLMSLSSKVHGCADHRTMGKTKTCRRHYYEFASARRNGKRDSLLLLRRESCRRLFEDTFRQRSRMRVCTKALSSASSRRRKPFHGLWELVGMDVRLRLGLARRNRNRSLPGLIGCKQCQEVYCDRRPRFFLISQASAVCFPYYCYCCSLRIQVNLNPGLKISIKPPTYESDDIPSS